MGAPLLPGRFNWPLWRIRQTISLVKPTAFVIVAKNASQS
jgi:hypothetical protein